ncbi:MAG: UDP-galactopyranose mutase [Candidatus Cybelea sp.]
MKHHYDYLVVGAGFAGSVLAERLAAEGRKRVLVIDRREHFGGNAYDCYDKAGVLIHRYGPHIFHTNSAEIFAYLSRFTRWRPYEHRVLASVKGKLLPMPINLDTINRLYGLDLDSKSLEGFFATRAERITPCRTAEDAVVSRVGRELYELFFRNYTRKQWGLDPSELDATVTARIPVRMDCDDRYFEDRYQAMPLDGYTRLFENMLSHPKITLSLGTAYADIVGDRLAEQTIYTGPIDEFFDYRYGKLPYRSLRFEHRTLEKVCHQRVAVVNYPNDRAYTRVTEYKHITGQSHSKTSITLEYPQDEGDPYYPVPRPENAALYAKYKAAADACPGVYFVGRLATYKYYNMDQVVGQALATYNRLRGERACTQVA